MSTLAGKSLLAIDIGAVNTRAAFFDVIEGSYRLIGLGQSPSTACAPIRNAKIGVQLAIEALQSMIGKQLLKESVPLNVMIPSLPNGQGVDAMVTTISGGPSINTLIVGLLSEVSLKSVENLAHTNHLRIGDILGVNDPRKVDEKVDAIVRLNPELVLIAGGVDGGASQAIQKILEIIGLGIFLIPELSRPEVLYAGNKEMAKVVKQSLKNIAPHVTLSPNIRPLLEVEDLGAAQNQLADIVTFIRQKQMPELEELRILSGGKLGSSSYAQSRMVRFLSSYFGSGKGVLSVDIGASAVTMGASFDGDVHFNVFPELGLGEPFSRLLNHTNLDEIIKWIPRQIHPELVRNYLVQKSIYSGAIPASLEELEIEQAVVRHNLGIASRQMLARLPYGLRSANDVLPVFEPILVGGSAITAAAHPAQKLLMLLDGIQPTGVTTFVLDQNNLLAMLGEIAEINSILAIQAIDAGAFSYLATVISPVSRVKHGIPIMISKLIRDDGSELTSEILMGTFQVLPLSARRWGKLQLRPINNTDIGLGPGRAGEVKVTGSAFGVVIDARGRPLILSSDLEKRLMSFNNWSKTLAPLAQPFGVGE